MLVYMLKSGPYVKLGFTSQPSLNSRLHQIRNACPYDIEVLAARPATYDQEQALHAGAIQWRHPTREKSDWYLDCPELRQYCDAFFYPDSLPETASDTLPASQALTEEIRKFSRKFRGPIAGTGETLGRGQPPRRFAPSSNSAI
jgi:hypothetical protein